MENNILITTWFQTDEAYEFFSSLPELFIPFMIKTQHARCVGYLTNENNALKQVLTRRAIIIGGPALSADCTNDELCELMQAVVAKCKEMGAIYIEIRNLNDYSPWRNGFEKAGFMYEEHLNFHVHTDQPWETIEEHIGKHRKKYIRLSYRDGAIVVEKPSIEQVKAYYEILNELYRTKVKTPLQPWSFFEKLYTLPSCHYLLVEYNGQIVGGSICMTLVGHGVYEWFACGKDHEHKNIYPSSVTKYAGMKFASDNGYSIFDMMGAGKPGVEYGVREFKAEFGGEMVQHGRLLLICNKVLYSIGTIGVKILKKIK